MSVGRWCIAVLCLFIISPAAAQQSGAPDIVVNGLNVKTPASWKRAEFAHVVLYSKGSDAELVRTGKNLERLYRLMSRLYRRGEQTDDAVKLQVTIVDSAADFASMRLASLRSMEGPYLAAFNDPSYYDPRETGAVLAIVRGSKAVDLNTNRAQDLDCADALADGGTECAGSGPSRGFGISAVGYRAPAIRTWQERLYAAFARHFILTYAPAAYPRWYLDGIGTLFSTMTVRRNGAIDYASPLDNYRAVFRAYGKIKIADVLAGHYLDTAPGKIGWTPYQAWLVTHYFVFSVLKPDRSRQFQAYMAAIAQGKSPAEAMTAFGNLATLQRDVTDYVDRDKSFARTAPAQPVDDDPVVTVLSPAGSATVEARLELDTRLDGDATLRDGWIAQLRTTLADLPEASEARLVLTEAECRAGQAVNCLADAQRVLAKSPDDVRALAWTGVALTNRAITGAPGDRASRLILARAAIDRAIAVDGDAPLPLIAMFQSYARAGEPVPDAAVAGLAKVVREIPAAPAPRLYLAAEMQRQGKGDVARRLVQIVLNGAYDSPERRAAARLFATSATGQ